MSDLKQQLTDTFIFETERILEQLEQSILACEQKNEYTQEYVNEIFRCTHTLKGSAAMMMYHDISKLAHSIEDLFFFIRDNEVHSLDVSLLSDLILESMDFVCHEVEKIKVGQEDLANSEELIEKFKNFLTGLKESKQIPQKSQSLPANETKSFTVEATDINREKVNFFDLCVQFEENSGMENIRSFQVQEYLSNISIEIKGKHADLLDESCMQDIQENGYTVCIVTPLNYEDVEGVLSGTPLIQNLFLREIEQEEYLLDARKVVFCDQDLENYAQEIDQKDVPKQEALTVEEVSVTKASDVPKLNAEETVSAHSQVSQKKTKEADVKNVLASTQNIISVKIEKLDLLMDLMGELVLSEAMVTHNPDLDGLVLNNFSKAARQHRKIVNELQDIVMSIRMVPILGVFQKMNRIVRDLNRKQGKNVLLKLVGEDTEVDKNIIEKISDPLMHMVRNAMDHGIESEDERKRAGKADRQMITLEAKNIGGDVIVSVRDNGRGLDKEKILNKAAQQGILTKNPSEMTEKEIYALILLAGFSTREEVTEYSGRGVGMDVVVNNIQEIGGSVTVDSKLNEGTVISLKIPLTLAIIGGMVVRVGNSKYTLPITGIKESFCPLKKAIIVDPNGNEMIEVRGECYPIVRLNQLYRITDGKEQLDEGILVMIESDQSQYGLFVDELIGEQQVVVKPLPDYINNFNMISGLAGCTILGDGSISLILDLGHLLQ